MPDVRYQHTAVEMQKNEEVRDLRVQGHGKKTRKPRTSKDSALPKYSRRDGCSVPKLEL